MTLMFISREALPRRTFLRGLGAAVALPYLDAMKPAFARAATTQPVRMAFVYVPNGMDMRNWNMDYEGPLGALPRTLEPLAPHKDDILVLGNLTNNSGRALLDGPGDHGRCSGSYLTGVQVKKSVTDIQASKSMDQYVADHVGRQTRFASLQVGLEDSRQAGNCDSGYSCAYTNNLSWRSETQPLPPILNPRVLFERLFGDAAGLTPQARHLREISRRSILDFILEDARSLRLDLGPTDRRKLDEYMTSIREIEEQLKRAEADDLKIEPGMDKPYGTPSDFAEHFRLMTDMITVAFQADLTRVVTFLVTREGTSRAYREIGIADGHHPLTHHRNNVELMDKVADINRYHVEQFSKWVGKLKSSEEGDGNLLDNSMLVYGAGLSDGNAHTHHDLPTLIAGRGGNFINTGRRVAYPKETPMCNLYLTMMERMGVRMDHFGDSTGQLNGVHLT
jgi:hypothetical protein